MSQQSLLTVSLKQRKTHLTKQMHVYSLHKNGFEKSKDDQSTLFIEESHSKPISKINKKKTICIPSGVKTVNPGLKQLGSKLLF